MSIMTWVRVFTGPALYKRYRTADEPGRVYEANFLVTNILFHLAMIGFVVCTEAKSDYALWAATALRTFCLYLSPLLVPYLYSRGYLTCPQSLSRITLFVGLFYSTVYLARGLGRLANPDYTAFLRVLHEARQPSPSQPALRALREFDSEFWAWPVMYRFSNKSLTDRREFAAHHLAKEWVERGDLNPLLWAAHSGLCWFAANTFAGWMMFPGHLRLYNVLLQSILVTKRAEQVEKQGGQRTKLLTRSNEEVDSMFIDRRNDRLYPNGNKLVLTCEGNAGFYEIGCMETPMGKGYSVLGWNHPGFGGSTGTPWPDKDAEAVEAVIQFATRNLGFAPEDIVVLAWSIGGYTATWATMNVPELGGLVLDATFDDLLPLAVPRMPAAWEGLVKRTVREYWDLPVLRQLLLYQGPVTIIRRTKDEIICSDDSSPERQAATNRSRELLLGFLRFRYPGLFERPRATELLGLLFDAPAMRKAILAENGVETEKEKAVLKRVVKNKEEGAAFFPLEDLGPGLSEEEKDRMTLYLVSHYLVDFDSQHCNPLPGNLFEPPNHPWE